MKWRRESILALYCQPEAGDRPYHLTTLKHRRWLQLRGKQASFGTKKNSGGRNTILHPSDYTTKNYLNNKSSYKIEACNYAINLSLHSYNLSK
jgi:hypothetical protein